MMAVSTPVKISIALVALPILWRVSGTLLRRLLVRKLTVVEDLKSLGQPRLHGQRIKGSAVVCGGSISGLWTARICADHFENVIVVESEPWLVTAEGTSSVCDEKGNLKPNNGRTNERARVSQYDAIHVYQSLNLAALRVLFPEFDEEMAKRDVRVKPANFNIHISGGKLRDPAPEDYASGVCPETFFATRETFEKSLRSLVRKQPNIQWVVGTVTGISTAPGDPERIEFVTVRKADSTEEKISATLVADCTGNSQTGLKWLKRVNEEACKANPQKYSHIPRGRLSLDKARYKYDIQGYARTFFFNITPSMAARLPIPGGYVDAGWLLTFLPGPGEENRCVVMTKFEGNRIRFGAMGWGNPPLPQTSAEIPDFLRSIKCKVPFQDWVYDLVEVLQEDESYKAENRRIPPCTYIRYDQVAHLPHNFIAVGDAVMCANPIWGQGCTKAAIGATILDSILRRSPARNSTSLPPNLSGTFFNEHHAKVSSVWDGTKPADYGHHTTIPNEGETLDSEWLMIAYGRYLMQLVVEDAVIDRTVWRARMFLAPPTDMMQPFILAKIAILAIKERLGYGTA